MFSVPLLDARACGWDTSGRKNRIFQMEPERRDSRLREGSADTVKVDSGGRREGSSEPIP